MNQTKTRVDYNICVVLTVVSTAVTAAAGTCIDFDSCALSTTQPWDPKVMMTALQPRFWSSWAARCASSTSATEQPVSNSACKEDTNSYVCNHNNRLGRLEILIKGGVKPHTGVAC